MQGSLDAPPIVIRQKRRWVVLLLPAVILVNLGFMLGAPRRSADAFEIMSLALPLIGVVVCALVALRLFWPPRMEIGPAGVFIRSPLMKWRRGWDEIHDFRPVRWGGSEIIGFDYAGVKVRGSALSRAFARMNGVDGMMSANMEVNADDLAGLLNQARARWADRAASAVTPKDRPLPRATMGSVFMTLLVGRVDRRAYFIAMGAVAALAVLTGAVTRRWIDITPIFGLIGWFIAAARMRDIGRSPRWLSLAAIAPILLVPAIMLLFATLIQAPEGLITLGIIFGVVYAAEFVALGLVRGSPGSNRYGPPPASRVRAVGEVFT